MSKWGGKYLARGARLDSCRESSEREAKSDNYLAAFKGVASHWSHTMVRLRERLRASDRAKERSRIQVNQVAAVAVEGHDCNRLVCGCSQRHNLGAFLQIISSGYKLPTNSRRRQCVCERPDRQQAGLHWLTCWLLSSALPSLHATCSLPLCPRALPAMASCCCCWYRGSKNFNDPRKLLSKCAPVEGQ